MIVLIGIGSVIGAIAISEPFPTQTVIIGLLAPFGL